MKKLPASDRLIGQRTRKLQISNSKLADAYVPKARVLHCLDACIVAARKIFEQRLLNEWPVAVASLDVPSARGLGKRLGDAVRADLKALAKLWK